MYKGQGKRSESLGGGVISEKAQSRIVTSFPTAGELGAGGGGEQPEGSGDSGQALSCCPPAPMTV